MGNLTAGNTTDMIQIGLDQSTFVPVCRMDKLMAYLWPGRGRTG